MCMFYAASFRFPGKCLRPQCKFYHPPTSIEAPSSATLLDPHQLAAFAPVDPTAASFGSLAHPALMGVLSGGVLPTAYPSPLHDSTGPA